MRLRIASVTIDCADVRRLTEFWSQALDYQIGEGLGEGEGSVTDPQDRDVELVFIQVPESKVVKNRIHLDIGANDRDAEVQRLQQLGATQVETIRNWTVMQDPEGNEFCVVQVPADDPLESWRA